MYNDYFGFNEAPFSIAPNPHYLYMTTQHREALAHLVYGLNSDGGCILLTGEVGTGKTTICRCLLEQIPEQVNIALVLNPKLSEIELLESICDELKIDYPETNNSIKVYTDRIYNFLLGSNRNNEKTVLIIDEAQNLSSGVLEQLRLLTNLETNQRKLLQIIILGQPELLDILSQPEMRQLAQRITARFHLQPLGRHEVKAYVSHRLAVAGQHIQLFPDKSLKHLYRLSNGIPRLINIICDRALLGAYVENQHAVSPATIKKAAKEVFGELKNVEQKQKNKQWLYPLTAFSVIAIISLASIFYFTNTRDSTNSSQTHTIERSETIPPHLAKSSTKQLNTELTTDTLTSTSNNVALSTTNASATESQTIETGRVTISNMDTILNTRSESRESAYQQLFDEWNITFNKNHIETPCKQAEAYLLSCLFKQGDLTSLKAHKRPAILTLRNKQGNARYVTITNIENDMATIYSDNMAYHVKLNELLQFWQGQFVLFWKKPEHYLSLISLGDSGPIINWLTTQLKKTGNLLPGRVINSYDDYLRQRVIDFQAQHKLVADGIVGPITIIHLNAQSDIKTPSLFSPASPLSTTQG